MTGTLLSVGLSQSIDTISFEGVHITKGRLGGSA